MPQWFARLDHAFAPLHLERLFIGRHKFHHFRVWYRDELSRWLREWLLDRDGRGRSNFGPNLLEEILKALISGRQNKPLELTKIWPVESIKGKMMKLIR